MQRSIPIIFFEEGSEIAWRALLWKEESVTGRCSKNYVFG